MEHYYIHVYAWEYNALANEYAHIFLYGQNAGAILGVQKNIKYLHYRRNFWSINILWSS